MTANATCDIFVFMKRSRIAILTAVYLAFVQNRFDGADLSPEEWEWAEQEIETRYGGDFSKLKKALAAEMTACSLACRVSEKD